MDVDYIVPKFTGMGGEELYEWGMRGTELRKGGIRGAG